MDSASRKRRWVELMRNEDLRDPASPTRRPVQVYLSDEARAVFGRTRTLAKELDCPSISNSELVEQLLLALDARQFQLDQVGCSLQEVLAKLSRLNAEIAVLRAQLRLCREEPVRVGKRSLHQVLERLETPPSRKAIALEIKRAHNAVGAFELNALAKEISPLLAFAVSDPEFPDKLKRRIEAYLERLFGLGDASRR